MAYAQDPRFQIVVPSLLENTEVVEGLDTIKKEDNLILEVSSNRMLDVFSKIVQYAKSTDSKIILLTMMGGISIPRVPTPKKEVTCPFCKGQGSVYL